jgi:ribosomal protein S12 methylthiotransferase accessory factor
VLTAIMECIERTAAGWNAERTFSAAPIELKQRDRLFLRMTELPKDAGRRRRPIAWAYARHLRRESLHPIPAAGVFCGYLGPGAGTLQSVTTNGLAAHLTRAAAIEGALLELIERHLVSLAEVRGFARRRRLLAHWRSLGIAVPPILLGAEHDPDAHPTVDGGTCDGAPADLIARFRQAGLRPVLKWLPNHFGLYAFAAAVAEPLAPGTVLATAGFGVARDKYDAASRALLELAQSRVTDLQGAREDVADLEKSRWTAKERHWLLTPGQKTCDWRDVALTRAPAGDLADELACAGYADILIVDFPVAQPVHVVRAVVPGLETWHATAGSSRFGAAARRLLAKET